MKNKVINCLNLDVHSDKENLKHKKKNEIKLKLVISIQCMMRCE